MLIYLATPYSHADPEVRRKRFQAVTIKAGELMSEGLHIFSPITHCHPIAIVSSLPTNWSYWKDYCNKTLSMCNELFVYQLDGWETSQGVTAEIDLARELEIPIQYIKP
jgi:hypothetical protein